MEKGICNFPLVACRKEANERSEMVTQLLYGESYEVIESDGAWMKIKADRDAYESWIDIKLHTPVENDSPDRYPIPDVFSTIALDNSTNIIVPGGSLSNVKLAIDTSQDAIINTALGYLNAPYLWGGKSIWGVDCSGFVQVVYQIHGFDLSRDAYQQAELGESVEFNNLIEPGDLAFFAKADEKISHVGICIDSEKIIHASGKVRIDKFDHHGIFNVDTQKYTHELRLIKRIKKAVI